MEKLSNLIEKKKELHSKMINMIAKSGGDSSFFEKRKATQYIDIKTAFKDSFSRMLQSK
jgi:pantothenate kinase